MAESAPTTLPKKERFILELLVSGGPMYGLQLVEQSGGALKRGTGYVTLGRVEAKRLVAARQEQLPRGAIGLPRRIYTPTGLDHPIRRAGPVVARERGW